jgi:hypothetical protein
MTRHEELERLRRAIALIDTKLDLISFEDQPSAESHVMAAQNNLARAIRELNAAELSLEIT